MRPQYGCRVHLMGARQAGLERAALIRFFVLEALSKHQSSLHSFTVKVTEQTEAASTVHILGRLTDNGDLLSLHLTFNHQFS
jgi:hypothetical protein